MLYVWISPFARAQLHKALQAASAIPAIFHASCSVDATCRVFSSGLVLVLLNVSSDHLNDSAYFCLSIAFSLISFFPS